MKLGVLAALDQRIGLRYAMPPMTGEETCSYLRHHLGLAGRSDTLFSDDATALIHQTSRGYPRAVNNLAVQALVAAFAPTRPSSTSPPPAPPSPRSPPNDHHTRGTLTTTAPPRRSGPVRHPADGACSRPDVGILNGAAVCMLNGGQHHVQRSCRWDRRSVGRRSWSDHCTGSLPAVHRHGPTPD